MKKITIWLSLIFLIACANNSGLSSNVQANVSEDPELLESGSNKQEQARVLLLQADAAYEERSWVTAKNLYSEAEKLGAKDKKTLLRLGNLSIITSDLDGAQEYFTTILSKEPNDSKAQYNLATVYLAQAENHFQYYIATLNEVEVEDKLIYLLNSIEDFSTIQKKPEIESTPLDSLRELLQNK